jgi:divalent metal cation (Fe/Co/Zn/Cd) transporter
METWEDDREHSVAIAIWLSLFTVGWNLVFGSLAIVVATLVGSSSLLGFGLDAVVDAAASVVLVWRFRTERTDEQRAQRIEVVALRVVGVSLVFAAAYVTIRSITALVDHSGPEASAFGRVLAAASAVVLPFLAIAKYRVAKRLDSRALRADSILTAAAGFLAIMSLAASALGAIGLWWADAVAALAIGVILFLEGGRSILRPPEGR